MKGGILIGHLNNLGNESALIRTAEAFNLNLVCVIGKRQEEYINSQGADQQVIFMEFESCEKFIEYAHGNNHSIICIENINEATEIQNIDKYRMNPIFITGNESKGIPKILLDNADMIVKIEQGFGYMKCLNTTIAASIVIHDFFKKEIVRRKVKWQAIQKLD